jgi:YggT family protein
MNFPVFLIMLVQTLATILTILVIVDIVVSYFLSPFHPIRSTLDRIVQPLLNPIRRVVPMMGMFDFSSLVLLILIQLVSNILISIISGL